MVRSIFILPLLVAIAAVAARSAEPDQKTEDEAAVRKAVTAYVGAFNRGDAKAAASEWAEDGEYLTDAGERLKGRDAIRKGLETLFAAEARTHVEVGVPSVQFVTPEVATVEGKADLVTEGEPPGESSYLAVYVKQQGKWKLSSIRETALPPPPSHYDRLKDLEWMIGHWIDHDQDASIDTVCQWTKNKNFITRSFTASIAEHVELEGTQVIGWDPSMGTVRSWMFDSDGGFAEGTWTRDGDRWTIQSRHVLPDGGVGSSTNILTWVDQSTFTWESMGREVDGQMLPNVGPVTIVRAGAEEQGPNKGETER
jgi:uncharacterized protein (TIGR02246 family)